MSRVHSCLQDWKKGKERTCVEIIGTVLIRLKERALPHGVCRLTLLGETQVIVSGGQAVIELPYLDSTSS
jgi:hypothetical protein